MSDIFIVSIDDDGNAGFSGPFASEAVAKYAAKFMHRPRLCRVEWLGMDSDPARATCALIKGEQK